MAWFVVKDPRNDTWESAHGLDAEDAEDAAELYMEYGEANSWWVGGDKRPDELLVLSGSESTRDENAPIPSGIEQVHRIRITIDWDPTFIAKTVGLQVPLDALMPPRVRPALVRIKRTQVESCVVDGDLVTHPLMPWWWVRVTIEGELYASGGAPTLREAIGYMRQGRASMDALAVASQPPARMPP